MRNRITPPTFWNVCFGPPGPPRPKTSTIPAGPTTMYSRSGAEVERTSGEAKRYREVLIIRLFFYTPICPNRAQEKQKEARARGPRQRQEAEARAKRQNQEAEAEAKGRGREARGKPPGPARTYKNKLPTTARHIRSFKGLRVDLASALPIEGPIRALIERNRALLDLKRALLSPIYGAGPGTVTFGFVLKNAA